MTPHMPSHPVCGYSRQAASTQAPCSTSKHQQTPTCLIYPRAVQGIPGRNGQGHLQISTCENLALSHPSEKNATTQMQTCKLCGFADHACGGCSCRTHSCRSTSPVLAASEQITPSPAFTGATAACAEGLAAQFTQFAAFLLCLRVPVKGVTSVEPLPGPLTPPTPLAHWSHISQVHMSTPLAWISGLSTYWPPRAKEQLPGGPPQAQWLLGAD